MTSQAEKFGSAHSCKRDVSCTAAPPICCSQSCGAPPSWLASGLGYGSVLRVIEPSSVAGDYTVIDLCSMCETTYWPDKQWRLDFLDTRQRLTWAYPVRLLIVAKCHSLVRPLLAITT